MNVFCGVVLAEAANSLLAEMGYSSRDAAEGPSSAAAGPPGSDDDDELLSPQAYA